MAAILEPTHTYWLTATQILSLAFLALATVISGFRLVRNLYRPSKQSQVRLPGDTRSPLTRKEEFSMNLLDGIETLPEGEGDFVEEERFWQKVVPLHYAFLLSILSTSAVQGIQLNGIVYLRSNLH